MRTRHILDKDLSCVRRRAWAALRRRCGRRLCSTGGRGRRRRRLAGLRDAARVGRGRAPLARASRREVRPRLGARRWRWRALLLGLCRLRHALRSGRRGRLLRGGLCRRRLRLGLRLGLRGLRLRGLRLGLRSRLLRLFVRGLGRWLRRSLISPLVLQVAENIVQHVVSVGLLGKEEGLRKLAPRSVPGRHLAQDLDHDAASCGRLRVDVRHTDLGVIKAKGLYARVDFLRKLHPRTCWPNDGATSSSSVPWTIVLFLV